MKKFLITILFLLFLLQYPINITATDSSQSKTDYGTAGSIFEQQRNPENGDTSNWLTLQAGEIGVRIVNNQGDELIAVDNFGGIYMNGEVYINRQKIDYATPISQSVRLGNGFLYFLLVLSLVINFWCVSKIKKFK